MSSAPLLRTIVCHFLSANQPLMSWVHHMLDSAGLNGALLLALGQRSGKDFVMLLIAAYAHRQIERLRQDGVNSTGESANALQSALALFAHYQHFANEAAVTLAGTADQKSISVDAAAQHIALLARQADTAAANGLSQLEQQLRAAIRSAHAAQTPSSNRPHPTPQPRPVQLFRDLVNIERLLPGNKAEKTELKNILDRMREKGWVLINTDESREMRHELTYTIDQFPQTDFDNRIIRIGNTRAIPFDTLIKYFQDLISVEGPTPLQLLNWRFPGIPWDRIDNMERAAIVLWAQPGLFRPDPNPFGRFFQKQYENNNVANIAASTATAYVQAAISKLLFKNIGELHHKMRQSELTVFSTRYGYLDEYLLDKKLKIAIVAWEVNEFNIFDGSNTKQIELAAQLLGFQSIDELKLALQARPTNAISVHDWQALGVVDVQLQAAFAQLPLQTAKVVYAALQSPAVALSPSPADFILKAGARIAPDTALAYALTRIVAISSPSVSLIPGLSELQKNTARLLAALQPPRVSAQLAQGWSTLLKKMLRPEPAALPLDSNPTPPAPASKKNKRKHHRPADSQPPSPTPPIAGPAPSQTQISGAAHMPKAEPGELKGLTTSGDVIELLVGKGWQHQSSRGSHNHFTHPGFPGIKVTVPGQRSKNLKPGTREGILKQAGLIDR